MQDSADQDSPIETQEIAPQEPKHATVWESLGAAIAAGRIDAQSLEKILQVQMAHDRWIAEKEFNAAFVRMRFPPILKTSKGANADYAPYDEIKKVIDPILASEGFGLTFTTGAPDEKDRIPVIGTLLHRMGHSRDGVVYQPVAPVSRGMNANQAFGSASTYGERDCARLMLNLSFVGLDNNADTFSTLLDEQIDKLRENLDKTNAKLGRDCLPDLLKALRVKSVSDIRRADLGAALAILRLLWGQAGGEKP